MYNFSEENYHTMNLFHQQNTEFQRRHNGPNAADTKQMLQTIGVSSLDELIDKTVPAGIRINDNLNLPAAISEFEYLNELKTVAVLAHGLDRLYPPAHRMVADKIIEKGGLLTDFISETNPDRENFPKRNRIVAGLSDATIVVEASNKGGALITAEIANSYNRDVFAVPGRLNDTFSNGCNRLIKTNKAALIESAKDIEYLLGWTAEEKVRPKQQKLFVELSTEEETIVRILSKHGNLPVDELTLLSELSMSKVAALLLNLEFNGLVKSLPGKVYQLC